MKVLERIAWVLVVMLLLAMLAWAVVTEPLIPNEDDCLARGRKADCWKAYDAQGRRVR